MTENPAFHRLRRGFLAGVVLLLFSQAGCALREARWIAEHDRDHPLVGRIWSTRASAFLDEDAWLDGLARADVVLLGEKHDHPDHHRIQARVLRGLVERGRQPRVGFELFPRDRDSAIASHLAGSPGDVDGLRNVSGFREGETVRWATYRPVVAAAVEAGLEIRALDVPRDLLAELRRGAARGAVEAALTTPVYRRLALDARLPESERGERVAQIRAAHCGHAPESALERMVHMQRVRDAFLAVGLLEGDPGGGAVFIGGSEHARRDRGVPRALARLAPDARVASVALLEVEAGEDDPRAVSDGFDSVFFTPRFDPMDPCERFGDALRRMRR